MVNLSFAALRHSDGPPEESPFEAGARLAMACMLRDWAEFDRAVFEEINILVRGTGMCFFMTKPKKSS